MTIKRKYTRGVTCTQAHSASYDWASGKGARRSAIQCRDGHPPWHGLLVRETRLPQ